MIVKTCTVSGKKFEITEDDLKFYKKMEVPIPTLCPEERERRRLNFRNERHLYRRKCDATGKMMISMFHADVPFPVYHITEWQKDIWNPLDYGKEFDFSRPFFEQFQEIYNKVPRFNAFIDPLLDQNSEYTNCSSEAKNCYLISQAEKNEDCLYSRGINTCKDCVDCLRVNNCELCYESIDLAHCYNCLFSKDCEHCSDCSFSTDLRGCKNCVGCHGLVQKEYYIFNKPVSKEEFDNLHLSVQEILEKNKEIYLATPKRFLKMIQCENSLGHHLQQCKNAQECFDCRDLEDCKHCYEILNGAKDCYDFSMWGINCERLYECVGCGYNVNNCRFCVHCWQGVSDLTYCQDCFPSVKNCFGCTGVRKTEYCILNKQYTKEEYEKLVPKIIEHMKKTGEWGEFFPIQLSPFGYNEANAQFFYPLTKKETLQRGWKWYDEVQTTKYDGPIIDVPENINDVTDDICKQILTCEATGKNYRIQKAELDFYRKMNLPVPRLCPDERHKRRMALRNPRKLFERTCDKCGVDIQTTFAPERPEKVFCEKCYLDAIN
jgi:hypothetical protein